MLSMPKVKKKGGWSVYIIFPGYRRRAAQGILIRASGLFFCDFTTAWDS